MSTETVLAKAPYVLATIGGISITIDHIHAFVGLSIAAATVITAIVNFYFKHREDKRKQIEHQWDGRERRNKMRLADDT